MLTQVDSVAQGQVQADAVAEDLPKIVVVEEVTAGAAARLRAHAHLQVGEGLQNEARGQAEPMGPPNQLLDMEEVAGEAAEEAVEEMLGRGLREPQTQILEMMSSPKDLRFFSEFSH